MPAKVIANKIQLLSVDVVKGQLDSPFEYDRNQLFHYDAETFFDLSFIIEESLVKADLIVDIKTVSEHEQESGECSAHYAIVFFFQVENFAELHEITSKNILELKGGLANALASISYSTARGILLTRLQGTAFSEFILPVIDPNVLLEKRR
jgi:hypothetical protein